MGRGLLIALLVVIIVALVAIPLIVVRRAGTGRAEASAANADVWPRLSGPPAEPEAAQAVTPDPETDQRPGGDTLNGVTGQVSPTALRTIRQRVEADPAEAARVLRRWLNEDR